MKMIRPILCVAAGVLLSALSANATPYASEITNNSGTIQFYLNEVPDSAWVIFDDGTSNNIASPVVGQNSFSLGSHKGFAIYCKKAGNGTPVQISSDSNVYCQWGTPRGVDCNANPTNGALFGRIYINNSAAGSKGKGLYALNADQSSLLGGTSGLLGANFNASSSSSPYRLSVGRDDNNVYLSDDESVDAMTWQIDPTLSTITQVLSGLGNSAGLAAGTHGEQFGHPIAFGSLANSNLVLWTADNTLPVGSKTTLGYNAAVGNFNNLDMYDIGAGPLPWTNPPNLSITLGISGIGTLDDEVEVGPVSGTIYGLNERFNWGMPIVQVYDPTGMNLLWDSISIVGGQINVGPDFFQPVPFTDYNGNVISSDLSGFAMRVSPDEKYIAVAEINNPVYVLNLTNGVPDISSYFIISNTPDSTAYEDVRGVAWDAADNVYVISSGQGLLRVFSLGTAATCVTSNDVTGTNGNFQLLLPGVSASVVATTPLASQGHGTPVPGVFTITLNTNFLAAPLTVNFVLGGTATNGTFVASATNSVTFPAGTSPSGNWSETVSITPTATPLYGPSMTVTLKIVGASTYLAAAPVEDTVSIANTGPQYLSITGTLSPSMYRGLTNDYVSFTVTRLGDTNAPTYTVTNLVYGGTAVFGSDYLAGAQLPPQSQTSDLIPGISGFAINPSDISKTVIVGGPVRTPYGATPVGNKSLVLSLGAQGTNTSQEGMTYVNSTNSVTFTEVDNAYPPEVVLWSDTMTNAADSVNWTLTFACTNLAATTVPPVVVRNYPNSSTNGYLTDIGGTNNWDVEFGYDISKDGIGYSEAMSAKGWSNALKMTVNKDPSGGLVGNESSSGVNVYPQGEVFNGNYALRFNMELVEGAGITGTALAEFVECGLNHYGTNCNWVSGDISTYGSGYTNIDGFWAVAGSDNGGATGGTPPDYGLFTGAGIPLPGGITNDAIPNNNWYQPVSSPGVALKNTFKHPIPYTATGNGTAADQYGFPLNSWSDVELKQDISGGSNLLTFSINKNVVLSVTNTTTFTNGTIMLGYDHPFGNDSAGDNAAVYISNVRVVELAPTITNQPISLTVPLGGTATFTATAVGVGPFTNLWIEGASTVVLSNTVASSPDAATLTILNATPANAGTYYVSITDASGGTVASVPVTLTVVSPSSPKITTFGLNGAEASAVLTFTSPDQFDTTNSYNLQMSTNLANPDNAGFVDVSGAIFTETSGVFTVTIPTNSETSFYRLQHK